MSAKQQVRRQNKADEAETVIFIGLRLSGKSASLILPNQTSVDCQDEFKCILYKPIVRAEGFDLHHQVLGLILGYALNANYTIYTNNVNHTDRVEYNGQECTRLSDWLRDARGVE